MRDKLIKATAWINVAILVLAIIVAKVDPDRWAFCLCSVVMAITWLLLFGEANLTGDEDDLRDM